MTVVKPARVQLTFTTNVRVPLGAVAQITARARRRFKLKRIRIMDHPKEWVVRALRVGDRPLWRGDAIGNGVATVTIDIEAVARYGEDIVLLVVYVGRLKKGRRFRGMIIGGAA